MQGTALLIDVAKQEDHTPPQQEGQWKSPLYSSTDNDIFFAFLLAINFRMTISELGDAVLAVVEGNWHCCQSSGACCLRH